MADRRLAKYGVEYVLNFELYEVDGINLRIDAADGGSDCTLRKDQGVDATAINDFVDEGLSYSIIITATEMQAKEITVHVIDSATKVYLDKVMVIETYGNASALHGMDFDDAVRGGMTALPNAAADAAGGLTVSVIGGLDLDTKLANTNEITVARMGALTDWINGGRLDLILDIIAADVVNIDGAAMRGTNSAATATALTTHDGKLNTVLTDTNEIQGKLPSSTYLKGSVDSDGGMDINDKADINGEVSDVLKIDTISEQAQGVPTATPTFEEALMYVYMALRNKIDVTASFKEFHNDSGTVIWKKALSDDGSTFTEAEGQTGA